MACQFRHWAENIIIKQMLKRFQKQLKDFGEKPLPNIHYLQHIVEVGKPVQMFVRIIGPKGSIYEFTNFNARIELPLDYPFKPPKFNFLTKIYHPNVYYANGRVCCCTIPQLKDNWSPALTIQRILELVVHMLKHPFQMLSNCGDLATIYQFKQRYQKFKEKAIEEAAIHGEKDEF